jgi:hypothetical protein
MGEKRPTRRTNQPRQNWRGMKRSGDLVIASTVPTAGTPSFRVLHPSGTPSFPRSLRKGMGSRERMNAPFRSRTLLAVSLRVPHPFRVLCGKGGIKGKGERAMPKPNTSCRLTAGTPPFPRSLRKGWDQGKGRTRHAEAEHFLPSHCGCPILSAFFAERVGSRERANAPFRSRTLLAVSLPMLIT